MGPRAGLDGCGKSCLSPEFDPRTVQPRSESKEAQFPLDSIYQTTQRHNPGLKSSHQCRGISSLAGVTIHRGHRVVW